LASAESDSADANSPLGLTQQMLKACQVFTIFTGHDPADANSPLSLTQRTVRIRWVNDFADFRREFEFFAKKLLLQLIFRPPRVDL